MNILLETTSSGGGCAGIDYAVERVHMHTYGGTVSMRGRNTMNKRANHGRMRAYLLQ